MSNHLFTTVLQKIAPFLQKINPVTDWVWPMVPPKTQHQKDVQEEREAQRENADLTAIDNLLEHSFDATKKAHKDVLNRLDKEEDRVKTAENKLATLFAMSAISAGLVLSVNGLASSGAHGLIPLLTFYCLMQLICVLFTILNGLKRRSYTMLSIAELAPSWTDTDVNHLVPVVRSATNNVHEYHKAGNDKITALAIAHAAFRNYLCGLTLLFVFSIFLSTEEETLEIKTQKIIHELQRHPHVLEILRSPPRPEEYINSTGILDTPSPEEDIGLSGPGEIPKSN